MEKLLYFVVFIYSLKTISSELKDDYTSLILDIQNLYEPSSIILPCVIDTENISDMKIYFDLVLELTKRKIPITTVALKGEKRLSNRTDFINNKQQIKEKTRSMSVILFSSKSAIEKLNDISEGIIFHVSINFILFTTNNLLSPNGFCIESFRNKLEFSFLSTILFKCNGDMMVRKWYQFNANGIEYVIWGTWEPNKGLKKTKSNSIHIRRANLRGRVFQMATVEASALTQWQDEKPFGYLIEIMEMLGNIMNFKTNYTRKEKEHGSWSKSRKTWSGALNLLVTGEVDFIVSDVSLTPQRLLSVDFTTPLFMEQDVLYIKKPTNGMTIFWEGYFQPFSYKIWIIIGLLIITTPLILALMTSMNLKKNSYSFLHLVSECYLDVWRMYCQQGLDEVPTIPSLRLAYFSISVCSFTLMSVYSAVLISFLAVPTPNLPFSTLNGFVKDGSYNMIVQRHGSNYDMFRNSNNLISSKMYKLMLPTEDLPATVQEAFKMVCNQKIAYYATEILQEIINNSIPCQVVKIPTGRFDSIGIALGKESPYRSAINYHLSQLRDKGILNRLKTKYFLTEVPSETTSFNSIGIKGIAMLLVIFSCGIVLSIILLFFEKCIAKV